MTEQHPRDLIQRLADELTNAIRVIHNEDGTHHISTAAPVLDEASAYLSQPEPEGPTDEELLAIAIESELVASNGTNPFREDSDIEDEVMQFARTVLARWGK